MPPGTDVRVHMGAASGSVTLSIALVQPTCSAGTTVRVNVYINGAHVGWVSYGHLTQVAVSQGQSIGNGAVLGKTSQWSYATGLWEVTNSNGVHTHFTTFNNFHYSCYLLSGAAQLGDGARIGILGGEFASVARRRDVLPGPP